MKTVFQGGHCKENTVQKYRQCKACAAFRHFKLCYCKHHFYQLILRKIELCLFNADSRQLPPNSVFEVQDRNGFLYLRCSHPDNLTKKHADPIAGTGKTHFLCRCRTCIDLLKKSLSVLMQKLLKIQAKIKDFFVNSATYFIL